MAMDLLVPAPMPDICVRLWKNCLRPASHVVPRLADRLHRDRTAIRLPSTVRSSGAPPFVSDFGKLPPYDKQVASIATMRKSSGRKPTPLHQGSMAQTAKARSECRVPCVPLVRLHSCPTLENCRTTTGRLHRDRTAIRLPSSVRFLVRLHFDRSRQTGRRRQGRRLVVITSVVSSVSVVASVVSSVSVGTA